MEETKVMQQEIETEGKPSEGTILLTRFIEDHAASLVTIMRGYVRRANLVPDIDEDVQEVALELLHEVYLEAIKTGTHFDPSRPPKAWLLGIANKLVLRKREEMNKLRQREVSVSNLRREDQEQLSDGDLLDHLVTLADAGPEQDMIANEQFEHLLSFVTKDDQQVLRLAIKLDLDGKLLAQTLGCSYKAALVRLCRARQRLRHAIERQKGESNE